MSWMCTKWIFYQLQFPFLVKLWACGGGVSLIGIPIMHSALKVQKMVQTKKSRNYFIFIRDQVSAAGGDNSLRLESIVKWPKCYFLKILFVVLNAKMLILVVVCKEICLFFTRFIAKVSWYVKKSPHFMKQENNSHQTQSDKNLKLHYYCIFWAHYAKCQSKPTSSLMVFCFGHE